MDLGPQQNSYLYCNEFLHNFPVAVDISFGLPGTSPDDGNTYKTSPIPYFSWPQLGRFTGIHEPFLPLKM